MTTTLDLALAANNHRGLVLSVDSDLAAVTQWLQHNDPNGCHTQEASDMEHDDIMCPDCDGGLVDECQPSGSACKTCDGEGYIRDPSTPQTYNGTVSEAWAAVAEVLEMEAPK